jgi:hypothetical protein
LKRAWSEPFLSFYPYLSKIFRSNIGKRKLGNVTRNFTYWEREPRGSLDMDKIACFVMFSQVKGGFRAIQAWMVALADSITAAWRASGLESAYDAAIEKYQGRAKRIRSWIWNGSPSRFRLSNFSETPVRDSRRQEHGMDENDSGSPYRLYGRGIRWGATGRRERFVLCGGESRCIWTRTKACARTGATSFRESSAASDSYWSDSGSIRKVQLRANWQDG